MIDVQLTSTRTTVATVVNVIVENELCCFEMDMAMSALMFMLFQNIYLYRLWSCLLLSTMTASAYGGHKVRIS